MDDLSTGSSDYVASNWICWYLGLKGNEYYCEVDDDYLLDRFNLTGLNAEVQNYPQALDLITDGLSEQWDDAREQIEAQGRLLYGLVHARYILTTRGLAKMVEKYKRADFGRCPRVLCYSQQLLPVGLSDQPFQKAVKLYCPRCEDIYSPKSSRHGTIDGAFFGSTFPHMLFMVYPHLLPSKQPGAPSPFLHASSSAHGASARGGDAMDGTLGDDSALGERSVSVGPNANSGNAGASLSSGGGGPSGAAGGSTSAAANKVERYRPRIFGFPVHETSVLQKWQERQRDRQIARLERMERETSIATQAHGSANAAAAAAAAAANAAGAAGHAGGQAQAIGTATALTPGYTQPQGGNAPSSSSVAPQLSPAQASAAPPPHTSSRSPNLGAAGAKGQTPSSRSGRKSSVAPEEANSAGIAAAE